MRYNNLINGKNTELNSRYVLDTPEGRAVKFTSYTPSHLNKNYTYDDVTGRCNTHLLTQSRFKNQSSCGNGFCRGVVAAGAYVTPVSSGKCLTLPRGLAPPQFYEGESASYYESENVPIYRKNDINFRGNF